MVSHERSCNRRTNMADPLCKNTQTNNFNWDHLRAFLEVARTGKLVAAANRIKTDHTTVARRITALERSLNVTLFERSPQGYALTDQGQLLVEYAEAMEALSIKAADKIGGSDLDISGTVRIAAPEGFGSYFLAPRLPGLIDLHPDLHIELIASPNLVSLSKREADLAIVLSRPEGGRLFAKKLTNFELGLFATQDYLERHRPIIDRSDLGGHRFVGYIDDLLYAPELDYAHDVHSGVETNLGSNNLVAQVAATIQHAGLCILPNFIAASYPVLRHILPNQIKLTREFWIIGHEDTREVRRIRATNRYITNCIKEAGTLFELPDCD